MADLEPTRADAPRPTPDQASGITPLSLLQRARRNDAAAWERLVQLYRRLVLFWCRRGGVPDGDAEDVLQEVFAGVVAGLDGFHRDRPGDTFRGWLRGVTRNQVLLYFRRNSDQTRAQGGSDAWNRLQNVAGPLAGAESEETAEVSQLYRSALDLVRGEFEERTWLAFWLTVVEDRTPAALAEELAMTPAAIRQAKSRVLRRLKQEVGDLLA